MRKIRLLGLLLSAAAGVVACQSTAEPIVVTRVVVNTVEATVVQTVEQVVVEEDTIVTVEVTRMPTPTSLDAQSELATNEDDNVSPGYEMTFDTFDDWIPERMAGYTGFVLEGIFHFNVEEADSKFWTYAGAMFSENDRVAPGTYEVQVKQMAGPEDVAYGLILGLNSAGTS
ncbi:MAG: hypothetical protein KDE28_01375, partial [Anaerolineales bacterium]|nr:hypothetical protein [Anaerolineales bacterium]